MYIYQSHLGRLYTKEDKQRPEDLYCDQCGDYDWEIGEFSSAVDFLKYFADEIDYKGSGGYSLSHVLDALSCFKDCPSYEVALKIVGDNREEFELDE